MKKNKFNFRKKKFKFNKFNLVAFSIKVAQSLICWNRYAVQIESVRDGLKSGYFSVWGPPSVTTSVTVADSSGKLWKKFEKQGASYKFYSKTQYFLIFFTIFHLNQRLSHSWSHWGVPKQKSTKICCFLFNFMKSKIPITSL